jgi:hypothetical protein
VPNHFEWYIFETLPTRSASVLEHPVRLGPFATEKECCDLLTSMKAIPRFSHSSLEVHRKSRRREKRIRLQLPVKVCRSASEEKSETAHTLDISNMGARLAGLEKSFTPGEVVEIHCGRRSAPFRVVWNGSPRTATEGQAGVECLTPEANIWDLELSNQADDEPLLQEIAVARTVQSRLFPQEMPPLQTLDYDGDCIQARIVGGDYYDFFDLAAGEVAFVLADISGKGVAAALLMANLQGSLRSHAGIGSRDLPRWLASVNRHFYRHTENNHYASLFLACYNDGPRILRYVNCGHNPPLLLRQSGAVEKLEPTATVLGLFRDWTCCVAEKRLDPGDILCSYTDGVTEATGLEGEEFGEARLLDVVRQNRQHRAAALLRDVEYAVRQFREGEQEDDLTLVIARGR